MPSFTIAILLLMLASIVLLGVLGDRESENKVHAKDTPKAVKELKAGD